MDLASPNYPLAFMNDIHCTYEIYAPLNTLIEANFTDIDLPSHANEGELDRGYTKELFNSINVTTATEDTTDTPLSYLQVNKKEIITKIIYLIF